MYMYNNPIGTHLVDMELDYPHISLQGTRLRLVYNPNQQGIAIHVQTWFYVLVFHFQSSHSNEYSRTLPNINQRNEK